MTPKLCEYKYCGKEIPITPRDKKRPQEYEQKRFCSSPCVYNHQSETKGKPRREFLERNYVKRGPAWCAKKLGIRLDSLYRCASVHGIGIRNDLKYMLVSEVAAAAGCGRRAVRDKAKDRLIQHRTYTLVPIEWGYTFIEDMRRRKENEKARLAGFMSGAQAQKYLGICTHDFYRGLRGEGPYGEVLGKLKGLDATMNAKLYNPHHVHEAYMRIKGLRKAA